MAPSENRVVFANRNNGKNGCIQFKKPPRLEQFKKWMGFLKRILDVSTMEMILVVHVSLLDGVLKN